MNDLLLPLVGDTDASMEPSALAALALGLVHVASAQEDAVEAILQVRSNCYSSLRVRLHDHHNRHISSSMSAFGSQM